MHLSLRMHSENFSVLATVELYVDFTISAVICLRYSLGFKYFFLKQVNNTQSQANSQIS